MTRRSGAKGPLPQRRSLDNEDSVAFRASQQQNTPSHMRSKMPVFVALVVMDLASIGVVSGFDGSLDSHTDAKPVLQASYRKLVENYTVGCDLTSARCLWKSVGNRPRSTISLVCTRGCRYK